MIFTSRRVCGEGEGAGRSLGQDPPPADPAGRAAGDEGSLTQEEARRHEPAAAQGPGLGPGELSQPGVPVQPPQPGAQEVPVWPKPPAPREVSATCSTRATSTRVTGATTSWAIRMPRSTVKGSRPVLRRMTPSSPR